MDFDTVTLAHDVCAQNVVASDFMVDDHDDGGAMVEHDIVVDGPHTALERAEEPRAPSPAQQVRPTVRVPCVCNWTLLFDVNNEIAEENALFLAWKPTS